MNKHNPSARPVGLVGGLLALRRTILITHEMLNLQDLTVLERIQFQKVTEDRLKDELRCELISLPDDLLAASASVAFINDLKVVCSSSNLFSVIMTEEFADGEHKAPVREGLYKGEELVELLLRPEKSFHLCYLANYLFASRRMNVLVAPDGSGFMKISW